MIRARPNLNQLHVLVVDDQQPILDAVGAILRASGAQVTTVASAEEAVRLIQANHRCDVLLSDISMDGLGGRGLFDWLVVAHTDLLPRLLFMSGDVGDETCDFMTRCGRPLVAKPFLPYELVQACRDVADGLAA